MGIIEIEPGAVLGPLTVKSREGGLNGETCWRCEDEKERSIVLPESEIVAKYVEAIKTISEPEPKDESEVIVQDSNPDSDCDKVPDDAAVAQPEPEQEEEKVTEEKPEPKVEKKKSFFGGNKKDKKRRK